MAKKLAAASTPELLVTSHVSHDATKHAMGERVCVLHRHECTVTH